MGTLCDKAHLEKMRIYQYKARIWVATKGKKTWLGIIEFCP